MSTDYRDTIFLPKAHRFPMRARLPKREPHILSAWQDMDLQGKLRAQGDGREKFVLHDGPPYANGHLHMGHALNKILKDAINRSMQMCGFDAHYVPGWDCHGLPIEWKVEEHHRAAGRDKADVPLTDFRHECREFARSWIAVQAEEFRRLGVEADWERRYTTMSPAAEAGIVREIGRFLVDGTLRSGTRPVLWSVAEETALADAEVEYHERRSPAIDVRFPVARTDRPELEGASLIAWTTTPWTIPANRALACRPDAAYAVVTVTEADADSLARPGERLVVARDLVGDVTGRAGVAAHRVEAELTGRDLAGTVCAHPLAGRGYDFDVPILPAGFVTLDRGTGVVHVAPGHGVDDWRLGLDHGLSVTCVVDAAGFFADGVPLFAGERVVEPDGGDGGADRAVTKALAGVGRLLHRGTLRHKHPHSWRSGVPLIHRATHQWFIPVDAGGLRDAALAEIDRVAFTPAEGRDRLRAMVADRPDWCISRQRRWGVPLPVFVHRATGEPLRDPDVVERVAQVFEVEGGDAWFTSDSRRFLGGNRNPADYDRVDDVVEVWFDSGSSHAFALEARDDMDWPADLYLEGTDQHRGWFQTSLLESVATRGRAPFRAVMTHGFVLDGKGRKMSKSRGNVVSPQDVTESKGADVLRLWAAASDHTGDVRISEEILRHHVETYRRLRNTLRFLVGSLHDFDPAERVEPADMPELERWILHRIAETARDVEDAYRRHDLTTVHHRLQHLCAVDLSAFYFDVRKDALYCDLPDSRRRRACRTVLDLLFHALTAWLAPLLPFTAEEAWWARGCGPEESVHLRRFPDVPDAWLDDDLAGRWRGIFRVRRAVSGAIEAEREAGRVGDSLNARPVVHVSCPDVLGSLAGVLVSEILITSGVEVTTDAAPDGAFTAADAPGVAVIVHPAPGDKCRRCWQVRPDVGEDDRAPGTCPRCADAVIRLGAAQA